MGNVTIHDVAGDFPHLQRVDGIERYCYRALLLGGRTVVVPSGDEELSLLLRDYEEAGVKSSKVKVVEVPVNGTGLYGGVLSDSKSLRMVRGVVSKGSKIDLFCASPAAENFIRDAELDWDTTCTPRREIADIWGRKDYLRKVSSSKGLSHLFPEHRVVNSGNGELGTALRKRCNAHGFVVKVPDAASSEGMVFLGPGEDLSNRDLSELNSSRLIVEEAYEHYPFSLVFEISDMDIHLHCFSLQVLDGVPMGELVQMEDLKRGIPHRGNIVGSFGSDLGPLSWLIVKRAVELTMPLMSVVQNSGYRGKIGLDLLLTEYDDIFLLECNARTSNSMYTAGVHRSVVENFDSGVVVAMANVSVRKSIKDYSEARALLDDLFYHGNSTSGVLMYHTPLISLGLGKAGLIAIAPTFDQAVDLFHQAELRLV
ncbi:MAG: hypothetical protein GF349_00145 [Candidatus Magasanikbacteria bacterium]|nr:hypothetical protein [Candidatus Magasanikbacteria bacterium]